MPAVRSFLLCAAAFTAALPGFSDTYRGASLIPFHFEPNQSRWPGTECEYFARTGAGQQILATGEGVTLVPPRGATPIRLQFAHRTHSVPAVAEPLDKLPGVSNYILGSDRTRWRMGVPQYQRLRYAGVYRGIDIVYYGEQQQTLEYDFVVAPGADPAQISLRFTGQQSLTLDPRGNLVLTASDGSVVRQRAPRIYQTIGDQRRSIAGRYRRLPDGSVGFAVSAYNHRQPLVIDPVLTYASYFGTLEQRNQPGDSGEAVAVDPAGNIYLAGRLSGPPNPAWSTSPALYVANHNSDAFVAKFDPTGAQLLYITYFGGSYQDVARALAVDAAGNAYAVGATTSRDLPTTSGAYIPSTTGVNTDAFALKLNATGGVVYATYLGGNDSQPNAFGVAADAQGRAFIAGTASSGFPTTAGAFQMTVKGRQNAFVTVLSADGAHAVYSTLIGGSGFDTAFGITLSASGHALLAGRTLYSADFPTTPGAFQTTSAGAADAFVAELNATGTALDFSTLLGGYNEDVAYAIATDPAGGIYVTGGTSSSDFPVTPGAAQTSPGNTFVTKLNANATALIYSTYLNLTVDSTCGSLESDNGNANHGCFGANSIAVDAQGNASVVGTNGEPPFTATPGALARTPIGFPDNADGYPHADVVYYHLLPTGKLDYSTLYGGSGYDYGNGVALDPQNNPVFAGTTNSPDLPVSVNAAQSALSAGTPVGQNTFLARLSLQPGACSVTFTPGPTLSLPADAATGSIAITAPAGCPWSARLAASSAPGLSITSKNSGLGSATLSYAVTANKTGAARTFTVYIADQPVTITQTTAFLCVYSVSPGAITLPSAAATGTITLTVTGQNCHWSASSNFASYTISPTSGTGSAILTYTAPANYYMASGATFTIADQQVLLLQAGLLTLNNSFSMFDSYSAFTVEASGVKQTRTLNLAASTGAVSYYTVYTPGEPNRPPFVTASPATGTTPSSITLTIDPAGLRPGTYTDSVAFAVTNSNVYILYTVKLTVQKAGPSATAKVGIHRSSSNGLLLLDSNGDGTCCTGDLVGSMGQAGDIALSGDWSGVGIKRFGLYRPSTGLFLLDVDGNGAFNAGDKALTLTPQAGDIPIVGDWTGTGVDRAGVFRNGTWYLDEKGDGSFTGRAFLGQAGDIPLTGNWNGVGTQTKVGIYRPAAVNGQPGNFFLVDSNGDGQYTSADQPLFFLGQPGDVPLTGNWDGQNNTTKVGIYRPSNGLMILDHNGTFSYDGPNTDKVLYFAPYVNGTAATTTAQPGDIPITGNWAPSYGAQNTINTSGPTRVGLYRPSNGTFYLDVSADGTFQARAYLGQSGDIVVGRPVLVNGQVLGVNQLGNY